MVTGQPLQLLQVSAYHLLVIPGAVADQRGGGVGRQAGGDQLAGNLAEAGQPHVEHQGLATAGQALPGQGQGAVLLQVAGDELAGLCQVAVGQRDAGIGAAAGGGGNARHHLAIDPVGQQELQLLGAAAEDEGVATLEPHHPLVLQCQVHQQLVDLLLGQAVEPTGLADEAAIAAGRQQGEQGRADQAVIDHHIGLLQQAPGAQGEQAGVAGAGADQGHFARCEAGPQGGGEAVDVMHVHTPLGRG